MEDNLNFKKLEDNLNFQFQFSTRDRLQVTRPMRPIQVLVTESRAVYFITVEESRAVFIITVEEGLISVNSDIFQWGEGEVV